MPEDLTALPTRLSASEFLSVLERSEVLSATKLREVHDRFLPETARQDSGRLARQLVDEGTLTEFQARRLLAGKKRLAFGRYVLLERIGKGARSRVFKARHRLMDRVVALKVVSPDYVLDAASVGRFFREMKIVGMLDHPNVVRALDADLHESSPYIVMEHLEGENLDEMLLRRRVLPWNDVVDYMAQAALGLAHAHEKGVIHRDIKPTNLFRVNTGVVKVLDLGFGVLTGSSDHERSIFDTDEGKVVGTTDFISPEQATDQAIDARTDLFSLGCTMYRLLTGSYAFPGVTKEDRMLKRIHEGHVPIARLRGDLPHGVSAVIDRLLAHRPEDRFGSAVLAAEALQELLPPAGPGDDAAGARTAAKKRDRTPRLAPPPEPEAPVDWSRVESALRAPVPPPADRRASTRNAEPKSSSSKLLASHRKALEADGVESGKDVHRQYRKEVIQMKRELESAEAAGAEAEAAETWLERAGEQFGNFLAEPSAGQILIGILLVLLVLVLAMGYALG
jgi:eukaryotic-like serine/threonine-protein kinase